MKLKESEIVEMELKSKLERLGLLKAFNELMNCLTN
jgi:small nuclear ribonucleoprotein (snRNP)-like protein